MPNSNNIWYKIFNHSPTEKEDWLDPSDTIFEGIENEIYPKKKKRRFLLFRFFGIALVLISAAVYFYTLPSKVDSDFSNIESELSSESNEKLASAQRDSENSQELAILDAELNDIDVKNSNDSVISKVEGEEDSKMQSDVTVDKSKVEDSIALNMSSVSAQKEPNNFNKSKKTSVLSSQTLALAADDLRNANQTVSANMVLTRSTQKAFDLNTKPASQNVQLLQIGSLQQVGSFYLERSPLFQELHFQNPKSLDALEIEPISNFKNTWSINLGTGFSLWNFKLNSNYQTALDPADFTYENGQGYTFFIDVERDLCDKLSVSLNSQFENISFVSGHNSTVPFDNSMTVNEVELNMASPIGFLRSRVDIENSNPDPSTGSTDLVLDLHNSHKISNWDFTLNINYNIYRKNAFEIDLIGGGGLSYISAFSNNLDSFIADNSNFTSGQSSIIADQENVNRTRFHNAVGLSLNSTCPTLGGSFGLDVLFKSDFKPLYSANDFSTSLNKLNIGLFYKVSF